MSAKELTVFFVTYAGAAYDLSSDLKEMLLACIG